MKFLVFLLLVLAVVALSIDDKNQRDSIAGITQERDQAQIEDQKAQQDLQGAQVQTQKAQQDLQMAQQQIQRLTDLAARSTPAPQPQNWFQQRLQQGTALDPAPTPQR